MSVGDHVHYLLVGNPLSSSVLSGLSSVARKTGLMASSSASAQASTTKLVSNALPLWKLSGNNLHFIRLAGLSGATAVILGAYGNHHKYPEEKGELRNIFEVANRYHLLHSIALVTVPLTRRPVLTGTLMAVGTLLFCGPCYYRAFTEDRRLNKMAPVGGLCLILAWASMMF